MTSFSMTPLNWLSAASHCCDVRIFELLYSTTKIFKQSNNSYFADLNKILGSKTMNPLKNEEFKEDFSDCFLIFEITNLLDIFKNSLISNDFTIFFFFFFFELIQFLSDSKSKIDFFIREVIITRKGSAIIAKERNELWKHEIIISSTCQGVITLTFLSLGFNQLVPKSDQFCNI